ncbi:DUF4011 domain-containing protein [Methylocapsa aurea]|uniref:DUF4011 domain-containing protein n=1 Tax=Methylocapsa aurea TaxID=663610 RepID=UPI000A058F0C|nr:DUF4011 domain-containing protein [Methylocapsa aurea]
MQDETEQSRLAKLYEQLRLKLLDLSKRNRMLNYSFATRSKKHLQIIDHVFEDVYRKLVAEEAALEIQGLPDPDDIPADERSEEFKSALEHARVSDVEYLVKREALESKGRDDEIAVATLERELREKVRGQLGLPPRPSRKEINRADHARSIGVDPSLELRPNRQREVHPDSALQTLMYSDELESILEKISSDARLADQEMGLSTLFLAFGFLEWYEADNSDKKFFAPLLLLPVRLEEKKVKGKSVYYLSIREGSVEVNLSLQKVVEKDFNRALPDFECSEDDPFGSIESYLEKTRAAVDGLKRWGIRRWLVLGHFAFGRFAMYADLNPENWTEHPSAHSLVNAILSGVERTGEGPGLLGVPADYPIDDPEFEKIAPILIHDADASQHSALIDVMKEKNLVIQGPPGTGKSQTITNIVANALGAGKRVLFLAEKQAALDVVKRRLDQAGLGDFCLELHSDKASPKSVIESLQARVQLGRESTPSGTVTAKDPTWVESRDEISRYVAALHAEDADGLTPFNLIWRAVRGRSRNSDVMDSMRPIVLSSDVLDDPNRLAELRGQIEIYAHLSTSFASSFGHPAHSPWACVQLGDFPTFEIPRLIDTLTKLHDAASELTKYFARNDDLGAGTLGGIDHLVVLNDQIADAPDDRLIAELVNFDLAELEHGFALRRDILGIEAELRSLPDLRCEPLDRLNVATSILRHPLANEFRTLTARDAYAAAGGRLAQALAVVEILNEFMPLLDQIGLDRSHPANGLDAVAAAAVIASKINPEHRPWIGELPTLHDAAFWPLYARWAALVSLEQDWRDKLHRYGSRNWLPADEIDAAAPFFRKRGIGKGLASLTAAGKAARALVAKLSLDETNDTADHLESLSRHVQELSAFVNDVGAATMLGVHWRGLDSPFENISIGLKLRGFIETKVSTLPTGARVSARIFSLSPSQIEAIGLYADLGQTLGTLSPEIKCLLSSKSIDRVLVELDAEIATIRQFLSLDPQQELALIHFPIKQIAETAERIARLEELGKRIAARPTRDVIEALGHSEADIDSAFAAIAWIRDIRRSNCPEFWKKRLVSANASTQREILREVAQDGGSLKSRYKGLLAVVTGEFGMRDFETLPASSLAEQIDLLTEHQVELNELIAIGRQRQILSQAGLSEFLTSADKLLLEGIRLQNVFETFVSERRADRIRRMTPALGSNGSTLEARRKIFAERDHRKIKSDRKTVKDKLLHATPPNGSNYGPKSTWTDAALLRNEFAKQRRFAPVRDLLSRGGQAIQTLKPCFMMSPLSLAKFLTPGKLAFDLIVIDEASQMQPEDALGGLLRAKQIVVVGDPKQLPPTDFFTRSDDRPSSDDDFEDIDDESILEACQRSFRELRRLKWHYRSRCESLIAFSNAEFYDNALITFPQARPASFSVDLVRVDGFYQARRNVIEAGRLAEEAVEFMRRFAEESEESIPTLGIVAVNATQFELLREEVHRLSANDVLVDRYREKVKSKGEEVFIKNLENVQGDERDFIFISLTYGREPGATAMKQRFGPINGKQGHRRLNVLFSRARIRVCIFASFGSADVKPPEGSHQGVQILKRYLEYAETRGRAAVQTLGGEPDSDFEIEVADRLRRKGYDIVRQVGVSGYRIDLGVRHPDHPEMFLAGVECDGASYHSSKSARDRDRLREEVLRGLGWDLIRVWSTDWFDNPARETEKLVKTLEQRRLQPVRGFNDYRWVTSVFPNSEQTEDILRDG